MKFFKWIKSLLQDTSRRDSIENFVASKHPKTTAEVEHWIQVYENKQRGWAL